MCKYIFSFHFSLTKPFCSSIIISEPVFRSAWRQIQTMTPIISLHILYMNHKKVYVFKDWVGNPWKASKSRLYFEKYNRYILCPSCLFSRPYKDKIKKCFGYKLLTSNDQKLEPALYHSVSGCFAHHWYKWMKMMLCRGCPSHQVTGAFMCDIICMYLQNWTTYNF